MDELLSYRKNALLDNLCKEWNDMWMACKDDKEKLVRLVLIQQSLAHFITYCYNKKGLSRDYILKNFGDFINGRYTAIDVDGVKGGYKSELYVGFDGILSLSNDTTCFMWSTIPSLAIERCKAAKLYVGCSSEVHLVCEGYNSLVVMLFDDSTLWLDDIDEESSVIVYRYCKDAKVEIGKYCLSEEVKMFDKELRL